MNMNINATTPESNNQDLTTRPWFREWKRRNEANPNINTVMPKCRQLKRNVKYVSQTD